MIGRSESCSITSALNGKDWDAVLQIVDPRERRLVGAADALLEAACAWRPGRTRPPCDQVRRILVLRLERIGDLMMSLPAIHALRRLAPHAEIDLVVGSWNAQLAALIRGITRVDTLDARWLSRDAGGLGVAAMMRHARGWRGRSYDCAINLEGDIRSNLVLAMSGARWCAGFGMAGGGPVLDVVAPFTALAHTATNGVRLVYDALGEPLPPDVSLTGPGRDIAAALPADALLLPADSRAHAGHVLGPAAGFRHVVGIQTGAGRLVKDWAATRMAQIASRLVTRRGAAIVLTGAPDDRAAADTIRAALPASAVLIDLVGSLDLVALAAVLERLSVFITPDTGPMHLAAAVGTPVAALFGPSSPDRWGPLSSRCRVVRVDLPCSPCNRIRRPPDRCVGHTPDCMDGITVDAVYEAAVALVDAASGGRG